MGSPLRVTAGISFGNDLRKMKAHGLIERDGKRYAYLLANSLFHHQPDRDAGPNSKLEAEYHKADASIRNVIQLLEAA